MTEETPPPADRTSADALKTVVEAYYQRGVEAADRERDRAERGYTIASAVAGALVAAGVFGDFEDKPNVVKALGLSALFVWVVVALLYVWAVAVPTSDLPRPASGGWNTPGEFMAAVSMQVKKDRDDIRSRARAAVLTTIGAVLLTFAALITGVTQRTNTTQAATVSLDPKALQALAPICKPTNSTLSGNIDPHALEKDFVTITVAAGSCQGQGAEALDLPRSAITGISVPPTSDHASEALMRPTAFFWFNRTWARPERLAFERAARKHGSHLAHLYRTHVTVRRVLGIAY